MLIKQPNIYKEFNSVTIASLHYGNSTPRIINVPKGNILSIVGISQLI